MQVAKMNPEVKVRWLEALRSGKFKQGNGALCNEGGYCCLGVLCEIEGKLVEVPDGGRVHRGVSTPYAAGATGDRIEWYLPPEEVLQKWDMDTRVTDVDFNRPLVGVLARMNDGPKLGALNLPPSFVQRRYTFEEIANWIEINL